MVVHFSNKFGLIKMKIKIRPSQDGLKLVPSWFPLITSCLFLLLPACFPPFCSYFLLVSNTSCLCPSCSYQLPQVPNVSSVLLLTFFLILVSFLYFFSNCLLVPKTFRSLTLTCFLLLFRTFFSLCFLCEKSECSRLPNGLWSSLFLNFIVYHLK